MLKRMTLRPNLLIKPHPFFSFAFSTHHHEIQQVRMIPPLPQTAKIIVPFSMNRYSPSGSKFDPSNKKIIQYDQDIELILNQLVFYSLESRIKKQTREVHILSTAGLHAINCGKEEAQKIEEHFLSRHSELLKELPQTLKWNDFIASHQREFDRLYQCVHEKSEQGSLWHTKMVETFQNVRTATTTLEKSVEYQRQEYAAIILMAQLGYTHLLYFGHISSAWSFAYRVFPELKNISFVRLAIERSFFKEEEQVRKALNVMEETFASPLSDESRRKLVTALGNFMNLHYHELQNASLDLFDGGSLWQLVLKSIQINQNQRVQ